MSDRLSDKLNLRLNDYRIVLNRQLNGPDLAAHAIKKVGLLGRVLLRHSKGEVIYWSRACALQYIDRADDHLIRPGDKKAERPDHFFNTSAFLHYTHGLLSGFAFQIMNNPERARAILDVFGQNISARIGETSFADTHIRTWQAGDEKLVLDFPAAKRNGYIHLILDRQDRAGG